MPHHNDKMGGNIFFPTEDKSPQTLFGGGPTFKKIPVIEDAAINDGKYPLVIYSHDWDAGLGPQAWLTADIAERGAIALHINHKHTLWGGNDVGKALNHWTRIQDLEVALDYVLKSKKFGSKIDLSRIMVVGFGEGGLTALTAGGATANLGAVVDACKLHGSKMRYCDEMTSTEVNLAGYDAKKWNASYKMDEVDMVAVIEPSLVYGLKPSNVENLVKDVTLFSFKDGDTVDYATDIDASGIAAVIPQSTRVNFNPAYRFSAALDCQDGVAEKLAEQGRYPICTDPKGSNRNAIHKDIINTLAQKLGVDTDYSSTPSGL